MTKSLANTVQDIFLGKYLGSGFSTFDLNFSIKVDLNLNLDDALMHRDPQNNERQKYSRHVSNLLPNWQPFVIFSLSFIDSTNFYNVKYR